MSGLRRAVRVLVAMALLGWLAGGALVVGVEHRLWAHTSTIPGAFDGLHERPAAADATGSATYVVVLTTPDDADRSGWLGGRLAAVLVVHLDAARDEPVVVALPLDTEVDGAGRLDRLAAESGPAALVGAVERLSDVRVEHLAVVDWAALASLAQHVGGIQVQLADAVTDPDTGRTWPAGVQRLSGSEVVELVSQRRGLADGEQTRASRQLAVLRAILDEALAQEMRKQPWLLYDFVDTLSQGVGLDADWSVTELRGLAWSMRDLRSAWLAYVVVPEKGADRGLWTAVREDTLVTWLTEHPQARLSDTVA